MYKIENIESGDFFALLGPNGAGKTTFFNLMTGFDTPNTGTWEFDGKPLKSESPEQMARMGMVRTFQLTKVMSRLTVMDNMLLGAPVQPGEGMLAALFPARWRKQEEKNREKAERLLKADAATLLALLTSDDAAADDVLSEEFVIRNEHGLHARPGTMLVNTIKQFESEITVANLDGTGKPANGRSLMKVVALGVKKGHRLRFTAQGADAEQALKAIGDAIAAGLGEGA